MGDESKLPPFLRSQKCPSEVASGTSNSNGELDEYHNFTEQNGINDTFLPPMVRAALLENSKPEKSNMKNEPGQDSIDKLAYQLGNLRMIIHENLSIKCISNFISKINGDSIMYLFCRSMDKEDENNRNNRKNNRPYDCRRGKCTNYQGIIHFSI